MLVNRHTFTLAASTGDIAAATSEVINGPVLSVHVQYGSATDTGFATTAVLTIATNKTAQTVLAETLSTLATTTVNLHRMPRQVGHTSAGVALTATESLRREPVYVGNDKLVITATSVGTGTRTATLVILTG